MRPLDLDYQRRRVRVLWVGWLLLLVGVVSAGIAVSTFRGVSEQKGNLEATLAQSERKRITGVRGELSELDSKRYAEEIKLANAVAERLTLPWEDLFQAIEARGSKEVALLALEPDVQKKTLRITAEARNKADMLEYVRNLNQDERLMNVHLVDHQIQTQAPGQPVRFSMQASWAVKKRAER